MRERGMLRERGRMGSCRQIAVVGAFVACAHWLSVPSARAQGAPPPKPSGPPAGMVKPDLSKLPKAPVVPTTFEGLFAERDDRAKNAIEYLACMQQTINALRSGLLGRVPTEWSIACIKQGAEWRAVFGQLTDSGFNVRLQYAMRGERGEVTRAAVDTARASGVARAVLRGLSAPLPGGGKFPIVPIALAQSKFVEVWYVSTLDDRTTAIVGGDSLIQMNADGSRELGHIKSAPPIRTLSVPTSGPFWELPSIEERIPGMSELMAARNALTLVPEVRVRTNQYISVLRRGATTWTHTRR